MQFSLKPYIHVECPWGRYGYNCNETCPYPCESNDTCNSHTGNCIPVNTY